MGFGAKSHLTGHYAWEASLVMYVRAQLLSRVQFFETLWIIAHQAPLSIGFSG